MSQFFNIGGRNILDLKIETEIAEL